MLKPSPIQRVFAIAPEIDHTRYPKWCRTRTTEELRYTIKDAAGAVAALPSNPKAGYYLDEISYSAAELHRRGVR